MGQTFERALLQYCTPVLVGLRTANLFRFPGGDRVSFIRDLAELNRSLAEKGLRILVLKEAEPQGTFLLYLYRLSKLRSDLEAPDVQYFLRSMGYPPMESCEQQLSELSARMKGSDFPHEVGVFLGYPLRDVVGFIRNHGRNASYTGCWKTYGDPESARKFSEACRQSTRQAMEQYRCGVSVLNLAMAG